MYKFLSDDWFLMVTQLNDTAGELHLPPNLANSTINVQVNDKQVTKLCLKAGKIHQGFDEKAAATVQLDNEALHSLIANKDINAVLEAFMMGKIRVLGDMSALMNLQSAKPTLELKQLYKAILAQTTFEV